MITGIDVIYNVDELNEMYADLGMDDVVYSEYSTKFTNIKKLDKPIEIPSEIELD